MVLEGFPACINMDVKILILGSMPGRISLEEQRYYAHPRNQFWWIMSELLGAAMPEDYQARLGWLKSHGVGLWDVLRYCEREGSLDSNIRVDTEVANPLPELIHRLNKLELVIFNGKKAEQAFRRYCLSDLNDCDRQKLMCLPSTSPANAGTSKERKLEAWSQAMAEYL